MGQVPVAIVVTTEGALTLDDLGPWLDELLARYKHPKYLVVVDSLPRNASGKVVEGQLRAVAV